LIGIYTWISLVGSLLIIVKELGPSRVPLVQAIGMAISLVLCVVLVILFHRRSRHFIRGLVLFQIFMVLYDIALLVAHQTTVPFSIPAFIEEALIISYMLGSKRVKRTFVR
jgi:hypothetical protein